MIESAHALIRAGGSSLGLHLAVLLAPWPVTQLPPAVAPAAQPLQLHAVLVEPRREPAVVRPLLLAAGGSSERTLPPAAAVAPASAAVVSPTVPPPPGNVAADPALAVEEPPLFRYYYRRAEVERMPQILADVAADGAPLERLLIALPAEGRVVIELWIDEQGAVDRGEIVAGDLPAAAAQAALAAFLGARFVPAQRQGAAVPSRMKIELRVSDSQAGN